MRSSGRAPTASGLVPGPGASRRYNGKKFVAQFKDAGGYPLREYMCIPSTDPIVQNYDLPYSPDSAGGEETTGTAHDKLMAQTHILKRGSRSGFAHPHSLGPQLMSIRFLEPEALSDAIDADGGKVMFIHLATQTLCKAYYSDSVVQRSNIGRSTRHGFVLFSDIELMN